jgi:transposase
VGRQKKRLIFSGDIRVSTNANTVYFFIPLPIRQKKTAKDPMPHYSPHKRTQIVTEYELGRPARVVAIKFGVSRNTVYGIVNRATRQISCRDRPKSGRPPTLSQNDKNALSHVARLDPFVQTRELRDRADVAASQATIRRFLTSEGTPHYWAIRRPFLTQDHADARRAFARRWADKPPNFWDSWIFSDETAVDLASGQRRKKVWCRKVRNIPP